MAAAVVDNLWEGAERILNVGVFHKQLICRENAIEKNVIEWPKI